ncbi:hypothetical protein Z948_1071 [Sulfitobacter donghicola DSW-25 = KCTC 12864 = JCM 14565]|nr:hypothetical protein Z948_1071 [Sulfitobacter donghicola DSW-25 = KCTC 12864 = JCM 14565]
MPCSGIHVPRLKEQPNGGPEYEVGGSFMPFAPCFGWIIGRYS